MTSSIVCREATRNDLPEVLHLYAQPDFDNGQVLSLDEAESLFERFAHYPDYRLYVALSGEQMVGTFALLIMVNLGHLGTPSAIIEDVAVHPQWQGKGVGKAMMRYALQLCREKGCYKAVVSSNLRREHAHAFYDSLDFERHGYSFRINLEAREDATPDGDSATRQGHG